VRSLAFNDLIRLPVIAFYEAAFSKATGVPLKVVAPDEPDQRLCFGLQENAFCALVTGTPAGCDACREAQARLQRTVARNLNPNRFPACRLDRRGGAGARRRTACRDVDEWPGIPARTGPNEIFRLITTMLTNRPEGDWEKRARAAYFATP